MLKFFIRIWTNLIFFANSDADLYDRAIAFVRADDFLVISSTVMDDNDFKEMKEALMWTWCSKEGFHGHHYIAARINGKVECRFSEANDKMQRQMGSGGNEYRFRFKGLFTIFTKQLKRLFK